ncbi:MAG: hypothetical protein VR69_11685 [Peptococcaceae bacterium BRH_c4b]|nr:MAG: hypothetical protein VR69_11685 [Peptococcaceae bacterium BRH_c4b]
MKIQGSSIIMSGNYSSIDIQIKEESLKTWIGNERPNFEGGKIPQEQLSALKQDISFKQDIIEISAKAREMLAGSSCASEKIKANQLEELDDISDKDKFKLILLQKMLEKLTGKKIKFNMPEKIKIKNPDSNINKMKKDGVSPSQTQAKQGWGLEYDYHELKYEQENMSFTSTGVIKTADGREINFTVELNMSREFMSQKDIRIRAGDAVMKDPLVINFDGTAPDLTDTKFSFDLDADGNADQISFVTHGSGFLALDLNEDGTINNGSELFGPNTGNGFTELAQYDQDHNNWIDENDEILNRLRIWTKNEDGSDSLFALGEKGIGAIYLGNVETPFSFKDSTTNEPQGQARSTGIFIRENGAAGTVQQIDLAV